MKTLGLIGGTSWHSTIQYYRHINMSTNAHFGDNTNPPLILFNLNQSLVHALQRKNDWDQIAEMIIDAGERLQKAGVESLLLCANTPHKVFDIVSSKIEVPIIHICDATSTAIAAEKIAKVGLIGTRFTMEQSFMVDRFSKNGIEAIVPDSTDEIIELHRIIQEELTFGKVETASKQFVQRTIDSLVARGAEGIVLGCTEFPLMFEPDELKIPTFNTTEIHAAAATDFILSG